MSIEDFIKAIENLLIKPGMYRIQSVEDIYIYINAEIYFNRNKEIEFWNGKFSDFVIKKMNKSLTNFDWSKVIRLYSGSDLHSIELFRQMFNEFKLIKFKL